VKVPRADPTQTAWIIEGRRWEELPLSVLRMLRSIALLEGQACNCMDTQGRATEGTKRKPKYVCTRCTLLEWLRGE
jgi:hypothetical protein